MSSCDMRPEQMEELIAVTRQNGEQIKLLTHGVDVLAKQNRDVVRWLLLVVCVIALGNKAIEMAQNIWGAPLATAEVRQ